MKIEWLVSNVTAVGSIDREEQAILEVILGWVFFCTDLQTHNVTAVRSPDRAESAIWGVILAGRCFSQFRPYLWSGSHFVM